MTEVIIQKSQKPDKKFDAIINGKKTVSFGQKGFSDYTLHKDPTRKDRYISRHQKREDWTKEGLDTSGFYSRWILWNQPTLKKSVDDLNKRYKSVNFKLNI